MAVEESGAVVVASVITAETAASDKDDDNDDVMSPASILDKLLLPLKVDNSVADDAAALA